MRSLFLARAPYQGGLQVGKVGDGDDGVNFAYGDGEVKERSYEIAAFA
jgi:hypothetical protein